MSFTLISGSSRGQPSTSDRSGEGDGARQTSQLESTRSEKIRAGCALRHCVPPSCGADVDGFGRRATPRAYAHLLEAANSNTFDVNSVPLSTRDSRGQRTLRRQLAQDFYDVGPRPVDAGTAATHSRVYTSRMVSTRTARLSAFSVRPRACRSALSLDRSVLPQTGSCHGGLLGRIW